MPEPLAGRRSLEISGPVSVCGRLGAQMHEEHRASNGVTSTPCRRPFWIQLAEACGTMDEYARQFLRRSIADEHDDWVRLVRDRRCRGGLYHCREARGAIHTRRMAIPRDYAVALLRRATR